MFDALQILSRSGFDIADYQYTGFGSIFFVDFVLFHKYLGVKDLLNVEHDKSIQKRVRFNRPFDLINVEFKAAAEIIPSLSRDKRHILWLDYDDYLKDWMLHDIASAINQLSVGSLLLVSVDVEPPIKGGSPSDWHAYYAEQAATFLPIDLAPSDFGKENLPNIVRLILKNAITSGFAYRDGVRFLPVFSFIYADGHQMYTVGGIVGGNKEARQLRQADFDSSVYIRKSLDIEPYRIRVPNLTRKERLFLDANMPAPAGWLPSDFELSQDEVAAYCEIYRFYPNYVEMF